jgi:hypothetical protein
VLVVRCLCFFDEDGLHGTRCRRAQHLLALRFVRCWIVKESFLSMQLEDAGGQETTLGIGLAAIQINHDAICTPPDYFEDAPRVLSPVSRLLPPD